MPLLAALFALAPAQTIAFEGASVHSMLPGVAPAVATILVRDGKIEAVGTDLELPEDVLHVDASGQHVVPGLVDGMVHHDSEHDALYVLSGVTLARDMGNDIGRIFAVREAAARNALPGPALLVCGGVLDGAPPVTAEAVVVTNADEVSDKLDRLIELGIDFVSFHLGIPREAWRRALEIAHQHGLEAWGPVPRELALEDVMAAGQDGLVGLDGFVTSGASWLAPDAEALRQREQAFARSGVALTPLLEATAVQMRDPGDEPEELAFVSPAYASAWRAELARRRPYLTPEKRAEGARVLEAQRALVQRLWTAGVRIVPGSGAPNPWLVPGASLHDELDQLAAAGIPARDVLRMATRGACEALGLGGERGAIAPGMVADLVFVASDPEEDLASLRDPQRVVVRGQVLERDRLDAFRDALSELEARARAEEAHPLEVAPPSCPEGEVLMRGHVRAKALGRAFAAERYAVVALENGRTAYCSRQASLIGPGQPPAETELVQTIEDHRVVSFTLDVHRGEHVLHVEGVLVGGQFRIERRMDELHIDTNSVTERVALVDSGSVTTALVAAQQLQPGQFTGLYFEDANPAVGRWELAVDEEGTYVARGSAGPWAARFLPSGELGRMERFKGSGTIVWEAETEPGEGAPK